MKSLKISLAILAVAALGACSKNNKCVSGSGSIISRNYNMPAFNALAFYGEGAVLIGKSDSQQVRISAQHNILDALTVEVKNAELQIGKDNCFTTMKSMNVDVTVPALRSFILAGSGSARTNGQFIGSDFYGEVSGSGNMTVNVDVGSLVLQSSGSGEFFVTGNSASQNINISGSADVSSFGHTTKNCKIKISGSGDCAVYVSDNLDVEISGSGNVYYKGNPSINTKISGSGRLIKSN